MFSAFFEEVKMRWHLRALSSGYMFFKSWKFENNNGNRKETLKLSASGLKSQLSVFAEMVQLEMLFPKALSKSD